jgi:hypothetical protein
MSICYVPKSTTRLIIDINNDELLKTIWEESMRQINGVGSSMSPPLTTYE